jgi:hypothetical protein
MPDTPYSCSGNKAELHLLQHNVLPQIVWHFDLLRVLLEIYQDRSNLQGAYSHSSVSLVAFTHHGCVFTALAIKVNLICPGSACSFGIPACQ